MWCDKCHYGSKSFFAVPFSSCPKCGKGLICVAKHPFPEKPTGMGSGKPNGKTAKQRANRAKRLEEYEKYLLTE